MRKYIKNRCKVMHLRTLGATAAELSQ